MTVALNFPVENLPENMEFLAIVNQLRGIAEDGRGGWSKTMNARFFKCLSHQASNFGPRKLGDAAWREPWRSRSIFRLC